MVVRVTVLTFATLCIERDRRIARVAVVLATGVALLAQPRPRNLQQEVVVRTVRIVTERTVHGCAALIEVKFPEIRRVGVVASQADCRCLVLQ